MNASSPHKLKDDEPNHKVRVKKRFLFAPHYFLNLVPRSNPTPNRSTSFWSQTSVVAQRSIIAKIEVPALRDSALKPTAGRPMTIDYLEIYRP
jgi:hypothetical protein